MIPNAPKTISTILHRSKFNYLVKFAANNRYLAFFATLYKILLVEDSPTFGKVSFFSTLVTEMYAT